MPATLRLWTPPADQEPEPIHWNGHRDLATAPKAPPTASARLTEFVRDHFLPLKIADGAADATLAGYLDATRYAVQVAGDPQLAAIDPVWLARVKTGLATATFRRSTTPNAQPRPLSAATVTKHLRSLRTILNAAGPDEFGALDRIPRLKIQRHAYEPRPAYTPDELRALILTAETLYAQGPDYHPKHRHRRPIPRGFWRATYGILYYTALRTAVALALTWDHIDQEPGDACPILFFNVPAALNTKTKKPFRLRCAAPLARVLLDMHAANPQERRLIPWPNCRRHLNTTHDKTAAAAGIDRPHADLHAVRRAALTTAAYASLAAAYDSAAQLAQHSDTRTTAEHYVPRLDLLAAVVDRLPPIWPDENTATDPPHKGTAAQVADLTAAIPTGGATGAPPA